MLNCVLPDDIRVLCYVKVPENFSARFNCVRREYKYFFPRGFLDIDKMTEASKLFLGYHDFRNFCKMDIITTTNFRRKILEIQIE